MLVDLCLRFGEMKVRKLSTSHPSPEHFDHLCVAGTGWMPWMAWELSGLLGTLTYH